MYRKTCKIFIGLGYHGSSVVDDVSKHSRERADWLTIKNTYHFIAIGTDRESLREKSFISQANQIHLEDFDRSNLQELAFGYDYDSPNPTLTSWLPNPDEYEFPNADDNSANNRLMTRLNFYYQTIIESDVTRTVRQCLSEMKISENEVQVLEFYLFGNLGDITCSSILLPLSYLLQSLTPEQTYPYVSMYLSLPTLFKETMSTSEYQTSCIDSYAALKELELLQDIMSSEPEAQYPFQFSRTGRWEPNVIHTSPANLIYLFDHPPTKTASLQNSDSITQTIADSIYHLTFSQLLPSLYGELDNFEVYAKQQSFDYSSRYGTIGSHFLLFPRRDIIEYAVQRKTIDIYRSLILSTISKDGVYQGAFNYDDPVFSRKSEVEQSREIENRFLEYIHFNAFEEREEELFGIYSAIVGLERESEETSLFQETSVLPPDVTGPMLSDGLTTLWDYFFEITEQWMTDITTKIVEDRDAIPAITSPSALEHIIAQLINQHFELSKTLHADAMIIEQDIVSGDFFNRLFKTHRVDPIAQRYFLIHLSRLYFEAGNDQTLHIPPFQYGERDYLAHRVTWPPTDINERLQEWKNRLQTSLEQSFLERLTDRDNHKSQHVARTVTNHLEECLQQSAEALRFEYWQIIQHALRKSADHLLKIFRDLDRAIYDRLHEEEQRCQQFLENPTAINPNAQVDQFATMTESLRDDKSGRRMWDFFYIDRLACVHIDQQKIQTTISDCLLSILDDDTLTRSTKIVNRFQQQLHGYIRELYQSHLENMNMDVAQSIILESQYIVAMESVSESNSSDTDIFSPTFSRHIRNQILTRTMTDPTMIEKMEEKIIGKFKRIEDTLTVLANVSPNVFMGSYPVLDSIYYSLSELNTTEDSPISIRELVSKSFGSTLTMSRQINEIENTTHKEIHDRVLFLHAQCNLHLFNFENILKEMEPYYVAERAKQAAQRANSDWQSYRPVHIEWDWETDFITLSNLRPMNALRKERLHEITMYFKGFLFDIFSEGENGSILYKVLNGVELFASNRSEGFSIFSATNDVSHPLFNLDDKNNFYKDVNDKWVQTTNNLDSYADVIQQLESQLGKSHHRSLNTVHDSTTEDSYYHDEVEVIETLMNELRLKRKMRDC